MLKKVFAFSLLLVLSGCRGGGDVVATNLTNQLSGCVKEVMDEKGGSVVIKSPAQYANFQNEINNMSESNESCSSEVILPEIDFGEGVFVAQIIENVCTLALIQTNTRLEGDVLHVSFAEDPTAVPMECVVQVSQVYAVELSQLPEGVSVVVD